MLLQLERSELAFVSVSPCASPNEHRRLLNTIPSRKKLWAPRDLCVCILAASKVPVLLSPSPSSHQLFKLQRLSSASTTTSTHRVLAVQHQFAAVVITKLYSSKLATRQHTLQTKSLLSASWFSLSIPVGRIDGARAQIALSQLESPSVAQCCKCVLVHFSSVPL